MQDQPSHIEALYQKWINGLASAEEEGELMQLLGNVEDEKQLQAVMNSGWTGLDNVIELSDAQKAAITQKAVQTRKKVHVMRRWWAAASVLLVLGLGVYFWNNRAQPPVVAVNAAIQPGKNGAVLTLADGREVVLDSLGNGVVATQNGVQVMLQNGALAYQASSSATELAYNTMRTPKGRQFHITLPDGTQVWLNSASSIRYPTVFTGNERKVTIAGEAYFEVAKNEKMPFRVNVNDKTEVEVLGTHFNVNAYDNEATINTTLMEGAVRVQGSVVLKPGEQAQVAASGVKVVKDADVEKVMAWKNGLFNFQDVPLEEAMRQLERWYDIDVVYEKGVPNRLLAGEMTRDITLNDLLTVLSKIRVTCRLEGRKMIVSE